MYLMTASMQRKECPSTPRKMDSVTSTAPVPSDAPEDYNFRENQIFIA